MNKVRNISEALNTFELLGIKDVTKKWQEKKGTRVYELPFKTMYDNGYEAVNRFTVYESGYVRKMVVYGKNNASMSCYQLNRVRKVSSFIKDYKWDSIKNKSYWTGKYNKVYNNERIMIDTHEDRMVYLCNYILKNFYGKGSLVYKIGEWTRSQMEKNHNIMMEQWNKEREGVSYNKPDDIKVIINGHRYNLA